MKTLKFNDFLAKNEQNSSKNVKKEQKIEKMGSFEIMAITILLIFFGTDIYNMVVRFIENVINSITLLT